MHLPAWKLKWFEAVDNHGRGLDWIYQKAPQWTINMDEIKVEEGTSCSPIEMASDPKFVKHVRCEGARFHVLSWSTLGTRCSESKCIVNKKG